MYLKLLEIGAIENTAEVTSLMTAKVNSVSYMVEYKNNEGVEKRSHIVKIKLWGIEETV